MLTWMQKHKKYLVVTIWVSVICFVGAGFVGWGSVDMNLDRSNSVAKVGHRNVSVQDFQNKYSQIYAYYNQLFDGKLSEEKANELGIQEQAVQSLVDENLLLNFADDLGLGVSDEDIVKYIIADTNFQTDGKFDKKKYNEILSRMRITPSEFEDGLKNVILLDKLHHALQIPVDKNDIELMTASFLMQDRVALKIINSDPSAVKIDENELKALWESEKNDFKTRTVFKLETQTVNPLNIDVNESALNAFYDENKGSYKDFNDKILPFESAKDDIKKDYVLKQTKTYADKEYLKIKKGEKNLNDVLITDEDNLTLPIDELKSQKIGYTTRPFAFGNGYMIVKIKEIIPQRIMSFEEAKEQIEEIYKERKAKENLEKIAEETIEKGFSGTDVGFIGIDETKPIEGLSSTEFNVFVSKMFESDKKKGYVSLGNKAVIYDILEQKLLDDKKANEYKDTVTQNVSYLKNRELVQDITNALRKRYRVEYYYKR